MESATGTQWVEFKDAAKQPAMHRKPPTTKTYSAKIDNSVEIEKNSALGGASDKSSLPFSNGHCFSNLDCFSG